MLCALIGLSCSKKEVDTPVTYAQKNYYPAEDADLNAVVENFLSYALSTENAGLRDDFPNTPINEGKWLLEASGNYLQNANIPNRIVENKESFDFSVENLVVGGEYQLKGSDLTQKFADLQTNVAASQTSTKLAAALDVEVQNVTSSHTSFRATAVYTKPAATITPDVFVTYEDAKEPMNSYAAGITFQAIQDRVAECPNTPWFPAVGIHYVTEQIAWESIKDFFPETLPHTCIHGSVLPITSRTCLLNEVRKQEPYYYGSLEAYGAPSNVWEDANIAVQMATEMIAKVFNVQSAETQANELWMPLIVKTNYAQRWIGYKLPYFLNHPNPNELDDFPEYYNACFEACDGAENNGEDCDYFYYYNEMVLVAISDAVCQ